MAESVTPRSLPDGDKIVRRLDPELLQALRDGDLLTGRLFCAQLFDFDTGRSSLRAELAKGLDLVHLSLPKTPAGRLSGRFDQ